MPEQAQVLKGLRKVMLQAAHNGQDGNLQSCFSSLEILWALFDRVMDYSPNRVRQPVHDRFVLSKGQATLALLVVMAEKDFWETKEVLKTFCQFDSRMSMQADRTKFFGMLENSAGSLGHGFPMAVGLAWGAKIKRTGERIYVLAGDGEMNEGTMWEGALFAASEKLNNLTLIVDDNDSISCMLDMGDLAQKLTAFGFDVRCVDGHDVTALENILQGDTGRTRAILAKTVRGFGSKTLMEDRSWFHRAPNKRELAQLIREVDAF